MRARWLLLAAVAGAAAVIGIAVAGSAGASTAADVKLTIYGAGPAVPPGRQADYTVNVDNLGTQDAATHVSVTVTASGAPFASVSGSPAVTCPSVAGGTTTPVTCTIETVAAGGRVQLFVGLDVPAGLNDGDALSLQAVSHADADADSSNDTATQAITIRSQAQLHLSANRRSDTVYGGQLTDFALSVMNEGPNAARNVQLVTDVPPDLTYHRTLTSSLDGWSCTEPTVGQTGRLTCTTASLPAGRTATITVEMRVDDVVADNTSETVYASATTDTYQLMTGPGYTRASTSFTIRAGADLEVTSTLPSTVVAGTDAVFHVAVTNHGPLTATGVRLTGKVPAGATMTLGTPSRLETCEMETSGGGTLDIFECTLPSFAQGDSFSFDVTAHVPAATAHGTQLTFDADATSTSVDPTANGVSKTTTVRNGSDLETTITAPASVDAGQQLHATVHVHNNGPFDATGVIVFADGLPGLYSSVNSTPVTIAAGATLDWDAGGPDHVVPSTTENGHVYTVNAHVTSTTTDPVDPGRVATTTVTVHGGADLAVAIDPPGSVDAGAQLHAVVHVHNNGPVDATNVIVFADGLPGLYSSVNTPPLTIAAGATLDWDAGGSGHVVPADTENGHVYTIDAHVGGTDRTPDPVAGNDAASTTRTVRGGNDVSVTVMRADAFPEHDEILLDSTIRVANAGPLAASGVVVTVSGLAPGVQGCFNDLPSGRACGSATSAGTLSSPALAVPAGGELELGFAVGVSADGIAEGDTISRPVEVTQPPVDRDTGNATAQISTAVHFPDLDVTGSASPTVGPNGVFTTSFTVTNTGGHAAEDVSLKVSFDANSFFWGADAGSGLNETGRWTCETDESDNSLTCTKPELAAGAHDSLTLHVRARPETENGMTLRTSARATTTTLERVTTNDVAHFDTAILMPGGDAMVTDAGCTANTLGASSTLVGLPFQLDFYGQHYGAAYVNRNGSITFNEPLEHAVFRHFVGSVAVIAPFWADAAASSTVTYGAITFQGNPAFCVNWTTRPLPGMGTGENRFQLLLVQVPEGSGALPGDFDVWFDYNQIQWWLSPYGDAIRGWTNGDGVEADEFDTPTAFDATDLAVTGLRHNESSGGGVAGRYHYTPRHGSLSYNGSIAGRITRLATGAPVAGARITVSSGSGPVWSGTTTASGDYVARGLPNGTYSVWAYPPAGSTMLSEGISSRVVSGGGHLTGVDLALDEPQHLPSGSTVGPSGTNSSGEPVVYYHSPLTLTTEQAAGSTVTYEIDSAVGAVLRQGPMTEGPAGHYSANVEALYPYVGWTTVHFHVTGRPDVQFTMYVDPSGTVRDTAGNPLSGATVTLLRSLTGTLGTFLGVADGSDVMSPSNRTNPQVTDASGSYGWDVVPGWYLVRAEKVGCTSVDSAVLTIPPAVVGLDLVLDCTGGGGSSSSSSSSGSPAPAGTTTTPVLVAPPATAPPAAKAKPPTVSFGSALLPPLRARISGKTAVVSATASVDVASQLRLTATRANPGKLVRLLKGTVLGPTTLLRTSDFATARVARPGSVRIVLRLDAAAVQRGKTYLVTLRATGADGQSSIARLSFRR